MKKEAENYERNLSEQVIKFFKVFKSFGWISIVIAVVFAVITYFVATVTYAPKYRSTIRFAITPLLGAGTSTGISNYDYDYNVLLASQMSETFPYILKSGILSDIISNEMDHAASFSISAKAIRDTNIFELSVTSPSAEDAYQVINLMMENYPRVAEYVTGDTRMDIIEGSEPRLAETPYNKNQIIDLTVIGAAAGLFIGCLGLYIYAVTRKSISSKSDIEIKFNGDCVCEIPLVVKKRSAGKALLRTGHGNSDFSESFRLLKQRVISKSRSTKAKVIGITSASRGEGKTTVAYNLSRALSKGTSRVLVVDMDLRDRSLQDYLNRKKEVPDIGISDVAAGKATLSQALNSISDTFDVLFAGSDNTKIHKSDYIEIFKILRNMYDIIIVDLSSCDLASETASTADLCDQILFVVKWNGVPYDKIISAIKYMSFSDAGIMGYILNQIAPDERTTGKYHYSKYYYNYGRRYGYGSRYRKSAVAESTAVSVAPEAKAEPTSEEDPN